MTLRKTITAPYIENAEYEFMVISIDAPDGGGVTLDGLTVEGNVCYFDYDFSGGKTLFYQVSITGSYSVLASGYIDENSVISKDIDNVYPIDLDIEYFSTGLITVDLKGIRFYNRVATPKLVILELQDLGHVAFQVDKYSDVISGNNISGRITYSPLDYGKRDIFVLSVTVEFSDGTVSLPRREVVVPGINTKTLAAISTNVRDLATTTVSKLITRYPSRLQAKLGDKQVPAAYNTMYLPDYVSDENNILTVHIQDDVHEPQYQNFEMSTKGEVKTYPQPDVFALPRDDYEGSIEVVMLSRDRVNITFDGGDIIVQSKLGVELTRYNIGFAIDRPMFYINNDNTYTLQGYKDHQFFAFLFLYQEFENILIGVNSYLENKEFMLGTGALYKGGWACGNTTFYPFENIFDPNEKPFNTISIGEFDIREGILTVDGNTSTVDGDFIYGYPTETGILLITTTNITHYKTDASRQVLQEQDLTNAKFAIEDSKLTIYI